MINPYCRLGAIAIDQSPFLQGVLHRRKDKKKFSLLDEDDDKAVGVVLIHLMTEERHAFVDSCRAFGEANPPPEDSFYMKRDQPPEPLPGNVWSELYVTVRRAEYESTLIFAITYAGWVAILFASLKFNVPTVFFANLLVGTFLVAMLQCWWKQRALRRRISQQLIAGDDASSPRQQHQHPGLVGADAKWYRVEFPCNWVRGRFFLLLRQHSQEEEEEGNVGAVNDCIDLRPQRIQVLEDMYG